MYRSGATALAADVTELRAEVQRLRAELRVSRLVRDSRQIEVEIDLDEDAQDLVGAILLAEWGDLPAAVMEDVALVARELTARSVRRNARTADAHAMLRVERSRSTLRVEVQALGNATDPERLGFDFDAAPPRSEHRRAPERALGKRTGGVRTHHRVGRARPHRVGVSGRAGSSDGDEPGGAHAYSGSSPSALVSM